MLARTRWLDTGWVAARVLGDQARDPALRGQFTERISLESKVDDAC